MLETWTFPDGVLGHTEIIIITLGAYIPRVLFNGYANFTDDSLHPFSRLFQNFFSDLIVLPDSRGLELFKTQNLADFT